MNTQFLRKTLLAFVLVLSILFGSGVIAEKTGVNLVPIAHACGASSGGGC